MDDDLIICTRNRPDELRACLETVASQTDVPATVTVVDSSEDGRSAEAVADLAARWPAGSALVHVPSEPGLVHQRIVGLAATSHPVVHFLDDDTVLEAGYFEAVNSVFAADPAGEIGGVGGFVTNQPPHRYRRVDVWLGLDSPREGAVLRSGRNIRVYRDPSSERQRIGGAFRLAWPESGSAGNLEVDWLSGCCMSYRRAALEEEPPDPSVGPERNDEDVELSYRVRQHRRLVVTPAARLVHLESPRGRIDLEETTRRELVSRWHRVRAGTGWLSRRAFWVSAWGQLFWYGAKGLVTLSRPRLGIAAATARGMRDIARRRRAGRG